MKKTIIIAIVALLGLSSCKKQNDGIYVPVPPPTVTPRNMEIYMAEGVIQQVYINGVLRSYSRPTTYSVKPGDIVRCVDSTSTIFNSSYVIINLEGQSIVNTINNIPSTYTIQGTGPTKIDTTITIKY